MNGLIGKEVHFDENYLRVELTDGRMISTPLSWYPQLEQSSFKTLKNYKFICDGTGIEWGEIDYHLSIESMFFPQQEIAA